MIKNVKQIVGILLLLAGSLLVGGCATLSVTPPQPVNATAAKQPVTLGVQAIGARLREALNEPQESAVAATSGKLFNKVIVLPNDTRAKSPAEIQAAFGTDYILTAMVNDISADGRLNPYFFASLPLFFFKPFVPIVTFESVVTVEGTLRDAKTGAVIFQKETSALVNDHFSPLEPQQKVRKMVGRGINNAFITLLEDAQKVIATKK